ncbi:MAG: hypothetical protein F4Z00_12420 [Acidimicrobiaceae bacterium]|nr:hypothetical protein [Acidimicrobiaceae bacterium]MXZ66332.1 hypothetical protein [Acidimicrobiaceae bacterium]MYF32310.1 hypothetical protein [Acidimicrobiaceae bacterium]MYG77530.1 hypothetical protein [Acidimicrobiaceae bacterium]
MPQPRKGKGARQGGKAVGGQFAAIRADDPPLADGDLTANHSRPLLRHDRQAFADLVRDAAAAGGLDQSLVERDYWMCQVATGLLAESKKYPGSYTSIGGGSLLSLLGITERLSEDVDISVSFVDGTDACSSNKSKNLMEEFQRRAEEKTDISAFRKPNGGGNFIRTVYYPFPTVLPQGSTAAQVKSDKGLRYIGREHMIRAEGMPYMGRFVQERELGLLPPDLAPRLIVGTHPLQVLADKLDAVCWREGQVPHEGQAVINQMVERVRDHYDIFRLLHWLRAENLLDHDSFIATVERTQHEERKLRKKMKSKRPERDRPAEGYASLRAWTSRTPEYAALSAAYPSLRSVVFGELPTYDEVCDAVHSAAEII